MNPRVLLRDACRLGDCGHRVFALITAQFTAREPLDALSGGGPQVL
jgi:hypothetical protein